MNELIIFRPLDHFETQGVFYTEKYEHIDEYLNAAFEIINRKLANKAYELSYSSYKTDDGNIFRTTKYCKSRIEKF